jgi:hypothetical protein
VRESLISLSMYLVHPEKQDYPKFAVVPFFDNLNKDRGARGTRAGYPVMQSGDGSCRSTFLPLP